MSQTNCNQILQLASYAGKIMLENGGEIYRVEQVVQHICSAYGIAECDCYATPTAIIVSAEGLGDACSARVRRISSRVVNLQKVDKINTFSRNLVSSPLTPDDAKKELDNINASPSYSLLIMMLASGAGTASFTFIFSGGFYEILLAFFVGALVRFSVYFLIKQSFGDFFTNLIAGAMCSIFSWLACLTGLTSQLSLLTSSALMLLTPGMIFTNALRDMGTGDLVAGISRIIETLCITAALACGSFLLYLPLSILRGVI